MLHKTHKPNIPIRLLTTRCNAAVENLTIFIEKHCGKLTENIPTKVNGSYHLIDIFEAWNAKGIPDHGILVSFDIVNMFPSIDNTRGVAAVRSDLNSRTNLSPSTKYILEALEICSTNNNSTFAAQNLIQTNGTAMRAANSFSYSDLAIQPIDKAVINAQRTGFQEIFYFGRYREDRITISTGDVHKIDLLLEFLNSLDEKLNLQ